MLLNLSLIQWPFFIDSENIIIGYYGETVLNQRDFIKHGMVSCLPFESILDRYLINLIGFAICFGLTQPRVEGLCCDLTEGSNYIFLILSTDKLVDTEIELGRD